MRQRAKKRWLRLTRTIILLDSESPTIKGGNLQKSSPSSNNSSNNRQSSTRSGVPPLARQPDSTIRLFDIALLADTQPMHWVRDRPAYDANVDFTESVYVLMHPDWVNDRLPKDPLALPMRATRGLFANCVQQQVEWKKQVEVPYGFLRSASCFFTKLKSSGTATRPLVDLSGLNAVLGKPRSPILPTPTQVIDYIMRFSRASSLDLSGWYSQIPAGAALSSICGTIIRGRHFAHITVPQGFGEAAAIAQAIATRLCSGVEEFVAGIIYDNFLLGAHSEEQLEQNTSMLRNNYKRCNVVENMEKATVGAVVEFCGMDINLEEKHWSVTDSWATKAAAALRDSLGLDYWSYEVAYAVFGIAAWFLRVRRQPFCFYREILSAQRLIGRRISRGGSWKDSFNPAPGLRNAMKRLAQQISINEKMPWSPPAPKCTSYDTIILSDASTTFGLGVVVLHHGKVVKCYGRKWTPQEASLDIHILEFIAFAEAKKEECVGNTLFLVDNTIVVNGFAKGHSPRPDLDRHIANNAPGFNHALAYVPTELNISDGHSRGDFSTPSDADVEQLLAALPTFKIRNVDWSYTHDPRTFDTTITPA